MSLFKELSKNKASIEIKIDEGIIEASNVNYVDKCDVSIIFNHPE